ncbi:MAG: hypothetical protein GY708_24520, partial [Actinomycetia bacterium]|nr:hypothetical protein [Actinomycetes bacterium]
MAPAGEAFVEGPTLGPFDSGPLALVADPGEGRPESDSGASDAESVASRASLPGSDSVESLGSLVEAVLAEFPDAEGVDKKRGQVAHATVATQVAAKQVDPVVRFSADLEEACRNLGRLPAAELESGRDAQMRLWDSLAVHSDRRSCELCHAAPPTVCSVLRAAGESGVRVGFVEAIIKSVGWPDRELVAHLIGGFPLVGRIPVVHDARPFAVRQASESIQSLLRQGPALAQRLVAKQARQSIRLLDPPGEDEVWAQTVAEIEKGRMAPLVAVSDQSPFRGAPSRRFAVRQVGASGLTKVRVIDDLTEALVNLATTVDGKIRMSPIADLVAQIDRLHRAWPGRPLRLVKADFSAAYRSCPIDPSHFEFAQVLVARRGTVSRTIQWAMPFGAVAAVYAWDRLAALFTSVACRALGVAVNRYVDDLFFVDFAYSAVATRSRLFRVASWFGLALALDKTPEPST